MNYTKYYLERKDIRVDINAVKKIVDSFVYFARTDDLTLLKEPVINLALKMYNMKKLKPEISYFRYLKRNEVYKFLTGQQVLELSFNLTEFLLSGNYPKNFIEENIWTAGRIFYAIDLIETKSGGAIKVLPFNGQLELPYLLDKKKENYNKTIKEKTDAWIWTLLIIFVPLSIFAIAYILTRKCRRKSKNIADKEDNIKNNLAEKLLN